MVEFAGQFDVHPNQIAQWTSESLERSTELFSTPLSGRRIKARTQGA
jgi:hypothetical protein